MAAKLERFTPAERWLHWTIACAMLFNLSTGFLIWRQLDDAWKPFGINIVSNGHVWLGGGTIVLAVLVFALFALRGRRRVAGSGQRFNLGQAINLRLVQGLVVWMAGTGLLVRFGGGFGLARQLRHQILQVHLVGAALFLAAIVGHLVMVFVVPKNRGIHAGMLTGHLDRTLAERAHPTWVAAVDQHEAIRK